MKIWTSLHIDVDYSPSDPGISRWFCDRTSFSAGELTPGKSLVYEDSGGLFAAITVVEVTPQKVVLHYGDQDYALCEDHPTVKLSEAGRDYTNFMLHAGLDMHLVVEDTPAFYREWLPSYKLSSLTKKDRAELEAMDTPPANYLLGRWLLSLMPGGLDGDELEKAEGLLRKAAEAGVADAWEMLSLMYADGNNPEDVMDWEESARMREKALSLGSELCQIRYARNRIGGVLGASRETELVVQEVENLLKQPDVSPEWYSVLGLAYHTLDELEKAEFFYRKGIENGCLRAYGDLAFLCLSQGRREEYTQTMEEGMKAGCRACYCLGFDLDDEVFDKMEPAEQRKFHYQLEERLQKGAELGDGFCAYMLGSNYFCGILGFPEDMEQTSRWLMRAAALGNGHACRLMATILEADHPSQEDIRDAARFRLYALRRGNEEQLEAVQEAYVNGLLDSYADEIEKYWLPEPDQDDGRWDAYA